MVTTVHIPKAFHSQILGPQGKNIKHVTETFKVKCRVPPAEDSSTQVTVEGGDEKGAIAFMEEKLGFPFSTQPLKTVHLNVSQSECYTIFNQKGKIEEASKKFGTGIRLPSKDGDNILLQGSASSIEAIKQEWSKVLKKTVSEAGASAPAYEHKVEINNSKVAEVLFFGDGDENEGDLNRFIEILRSGNSTLDICVFTITHNRIAKAIENEFRQGVKVRIITDNHTSEALGSDIESLARMGIPIKQDVSEGHMHHKFAVVDSKLLINGSFNWTTGATNQNYENVMITNEPDFVKAFANEFNRLWKDEKRFASV
jgi:hypothetical protein